jgi:hypothetical protein
MIKKVLSVTKNQVLRFVHRLCLWTKPAYIKHRTTYQKQFDIKLQYTFWGCLIGMLLVALLVNIYPEKEKPSEETPYGDVPSEKKVDLNVTVAGKIKYVSGAKKDDGNTAKINTLKDPVVIVYE